MDCRRDLVERAVQDGASVRGLCREYNVSPTTAYKWIARHREQGEAGLVSRSRRPLTSPARASPEVETLVLGLRDERPTWGARKIRAELLRRQQLNALASSPSMPAARSSLVRSSVPAASTVQRILARHGLIDPIEARKHRPHQRFERAEPNELWQLDFKGHTALQDGSRVHPLAALDDHSRYLVLLDACAREDASTVWTSLQRAFREHGLPNAILCDNGGPWAAGGRPGESRLTVRLQRYGIQVLHGRPRHPQTQGKLERFHRTLGQDALVEMPANLLDCEARFNEYRRVYNHVRPHEALGLSAPASRYQSSERAFPERLAPLEYPDSSSVRVVGSGGLVHYCGRRYKVGKAYRGERVMLRDTSEDGLMEVVFCTSVIATLNLRRRA